MKTEIEVAQLFCFLNFNEQTFAYEPIALFNLSKEDTVLEKDLEVHIFFFIELFSSSGKQTSPNNSFLILSALMFKFDFNHCEFVCLNCKAVCIPYFLRKIVILLPIPHNSSTGILARILSISC